MTISLVRRKGAFLYQASSIEKSTVKGCTTGARDYIQFCMARSLPIDHTPHSPVTSHSRFIASGPNKYLTGVRYFLSAMYPDFDANRSHPPVTSVIRGSKKIRADAGPRLSPENFPFAYIYLRFYPVLNHPSPMTTSYS